MEWLNEEYNNIKPLFSKAEIYSGEHKITKRINSLYIISNNESEANNEHENTNKRIEIWTNSIHKNIINIYFAHKEKKNIILMGEKIEINLEEYLNLRNIDLAQNPPILSIGKYIRIMRRYKQRN